MGLKIGWLTIDTRDVEKLTSFWEQALPNSKRVYEDKDEGEIVLRSPYGLRLLFLKVPDDKVVKNRLHLDLIPDDRDAEVARLEGLGATRANVGQSDDVSWVVMADPQGNEFCVLSARPKEGHVGGLKIGQVNVDSRDVEKLASFWEQALPGSERVYEGEGGIDVQTPEGWVLAFFPVPDDKVVKNRLHFDLLPDDRDAEVARLEGMGATRVDIGQNKDDITWVVLADPEGNEFCVLRPGADEGT